MPLNQNRKIKNIYKDVVLLSGRAYRLLIDKYNQSQICLLRSLLRFPIRRLLCAALCSCGIRL